MFKDDEKAKKEDVPYLWVRVMVSVVCLLRRTDIRARGYCLKKRDMTNPFYISRTS